MRIRYQCPYCGANLDPGEKCDCQELEEDTGPENKKAAMPASTAADPQEDGDNL